MNLQTDEHVPQSKETLRNRNGAVSYRLYADAPVNPSLSLWAFFRLDSSLVIEHDDVEVSVKIAAFSWRMPFCEDAVPRLIREWLRKGGGAPLEEAAISEICLGYMMYEARSDDVYYNQRRTEEFAAALKHDNKDEEEIPF